MAPIILFLCAFSAFTATSSALRCYTCSVVESDTDQRCVTNPDQVEIGAPITNCNKKYCISVRQEYVQPKGKVASMIRNCVDDPLFINEVIEDATFRTYYRACQEDLCNDGTGYDTTGNIGIVDQDTGGVIYTQGIGKNSAYYLQVQSLFVAFLFICNNLISNVILSEWS